LHENETIREEEQKITKKNAKNARERMNTVRESETARESERS